MSKSPLTSVQKRAGALLSRDESVALHFGNAAAEYESARNACALIDIGDRTQIEITGNDRATFLHNFCTNDIKALQPGEGCEAFITNVKGRVLGPRNDRQSRSAPPRSGKRTLAFYPHSRSSCRDSPSRCPTTTRSFTTSSRFRDRMTSI